MAHDGHWKEAPEEEHELAISSSKSATLLSGGTAGETTSSSQAFEKWLVLVRRRSGKYRMSGFPNRQMKLEGMPVRSLRSFPSSSSWFSSLDVFEKTSPGVPHCAHYELESPLPSDHAPEVSLWERLGNAAAVDIDVDELSWNTLSSLHHTEHSSSTEQSEDEMCKPLEVTVNSGGIVFFALFDNSEDSVSAKESAAVIKFASSRMATQSERLGYEFAKWLGVQTPQADAELNKELEQWNEILKADVIQSCHENNFNTGFFEGNDSNIVVDAYELKVRLEHMLERITLISDAANTERPSHITGNLFIGGALSARSVHTLEHLGITHILCLCSNEIGQSDSQYPELFEYRNFSIDDTEDADISDLFDAASEYIDYVDNLGNKILVHCFEGRSRSATVVLAYLMLRKNLTLSEAWNMLKKTHRRAQPNDGFAKILLELDKKLHGKASMEWKQRRPTMWACPICGKDAGLSSASLKLHLQKAHRKISSGSVDSAMKMEIQRALDSLKLSRSGSTSPNSKQAQSFNQFT